MKPAKKLTTLLDKLAAIPLAQHREKIEFTLADARSLAAHGEWGLGLENLCSNLYEFDFPLTPELFREIETLAVEWGLDHSWIDPLRSSLE